MASAVRGGDRARRAGPLAVALAVTGVLAAGCSGGPAGPGVAGASSASVSASASATVSGEAEALEYAACMRSHGVPNFPDPTVQNGSVGFSITAGDGVDQNSPHYQSARQACSSLRGGGTASSGSGNLAKELKFAQCMRSHGVPGFPDPNKNGGFSGTSSINPSSPTFQNAQSTCMQLSGLGGPGSSS
ncbi:MAG TPA: hypothetical protein VI365_07700 [Trebonia sp.]